MACSTALDLGHQNDKNDDDDDTEEEEEEEEEERGLEHADVWLLQSCPS